MMKLQEFISRTAKKGSYTVGGFHRHYQKIRPRLICKDGISISVQASENHYCYPRMSFLDNYHAYEVGYPSIVPPEDWIEYCENWDKPTDTVYAYMPAHLIQSFIDSHGGIDVVRTFECEEL